MVFKYIYIYYKIQLKLFCFDLLDLVYLVYLSLYEKLVRFLIDFFHNFYVFCFLFCFFLGFFCFHCKIVIFVKARASI